MTGSIDLVTNSWCSLVEILITMIGKLSGKVVVREARPRVVPASRFPGEKRCQNRHYLKPYKLAKPISLGRLPDGVTVKHKTMFSSRPSVQICCQAEMRALGLQHRSTIHCGVFEGQRCIFSEVLKSRIWTFCSATTVDQMQCYSKNHIE
ncbi:uncharacterized protein BCR38DRAFT_146615 [Pseudomassariella vexata]|uniref:Uncharacterized protein n=1 Tax=Pseudomassariella vexata TaxID=1141098 RepID=A0A1Y2D7T7_9PEZI|nr:uncharacterized protein BCR38DRAFT_146615 [Pseudomassariella vexata]ORY54695.1 hypothetical protein BCR38DRAFT_146615 [Pseudomassariella vexata]